MPGRAGIHQHFVCIETTISGVKYKFLGSYPLPWYSQTPRTLIFYMMLIFKDDKFLCQLTSWETANVRLSGVTEESCQGEKGVVITSVTKK
jgi:hypothetical protein